MKMSSGILMIILSPKENPQSYRFKEKQKYILIQFSSSARLKGQTWQIKKTGQKYVWKPVLNSECQEMK